VPDAKEIKQALDVPGANGMVSVVLVGCADYGDPQTLARY
jgi:hypothetical protein